MNEIKQLVISQEDADTLLWELKKLVDEVALNLTLIRHERGDRVANSLVLRLNRSKSTIDRIEGGGK